MDQLHITREVVSSVKKTSLQLQSSLLATEESLETKKENLNVVKTTYPLDIQAIIDLQIEIESLEDGIKRMNILKEELGL